MGKEKMKSKLELNFNIEYSLEELIKRGYEDRGKFGIKGDLYLFAKKDGTQGYLLRKSHEDKYFMWIGFRI
jgi:hypothetical protein